MSARVSPSGVLHLTKECSAYTGQPRSFCTIDSSDFSGIPVGSKVVYEEGMTATGLDTDILVTTPNGDQVKGHVLLDSSTGTGTVRLGGGTGQLIGLSADLVVVALEVPRYRWEGSYLQST
jgi:hypothetical protein